MPKYIGIFRLVYFVEKYNKIMKNYEKFPQNSENIEKILYGKTYKYL